MLIGLVGRKNSGKSTVAKYLRENHTFCELTFAEPLKRICMELGAPIDSIYGTQAQKEEIIPSLGVSGREMLQKIGTELFRNHFHEAIPNYQLGNDSIWVRVMRRKLQPLKKCEMVISDCRFEDEARMIKEMGGVLIHIDREGEQFDDHASEIISIESNYTVTNNGTKEELFEKIEKILSIEDFDRNWNLLNE